MNNKVTCKLSSESCRDIKSSYSVNENKEDKNKEDEWKTEKVKMNKEMISDCNDNKNKMSLLSFTKKRSQSTLDKKPLLQCHSKCCHFSSSLSWNDEMKSDDESVISRYTFFKSYNVLTSQLTLSCFCRSESDVSNDKIKLADLQLSQHLIFKTTVIYKQQS